MSESALKISYLIHGEQRGAEFVGDLYAGLLHAARQLTGDERLRLIAELQSKHAELEAVGR
jgi:hypothetical protein